MGTFRTWAFTAMFAVAIVVLSIALWSIVAPRIDGSLLLAAFLGLSATGLAGAAYLRVGRAAEGAEKISGDLDIMSRRLLRVESRLAEIERQPHAELRKTVAEVSGEIALLSGLLRDLASTVSGHDRDVAMLAQELYALRERADATIPAASPPAALPATALPAAHAASTTPPLDAPAMGVAWQRQLTGFAPEAATGSPQPRGATGMRSAEPAIVEPAHPPANDSPGDAVAASMAASIIASRGDYVGEARAESDPGLFMEARDAASDSPAEQRRRAILDAFREDRLEIHLQPVVSLPQRKTRFYEALARLRIDDETLLVPGEFMPALDEAGLAPELDGKVAARAAAVARHLVNRGSDAFVSSNLGPAAMRAPSFLRALGRILEAYPDVLGRLAFEISQRSWRTLDAETAGALEQLRGKGAFFLLDRASDLRLDPLTLADRGVRYVKLPAAMLVDPQPSHGRDFEIADLAAVLARAGITLVAEKVEAEQVVPDLIDLEIPMGQGIVFAAPRAVRGDIFNLGKRQGAAPKAPPQSATGTQPAPAARQEPAPAKVRPPQPAAPPAEASEPRLPYRSFLRRTG